jgi:hypothetical protein
MLPIWPQSSGCGSYGDTVAAHSPRTSRTIAASTVTRAAQALHNGRLRGGFPGFQENREPTFIGFTSFAG